MKWSAVTRENLDPPGVTGVTQWSLCPVDRVADGYWLESWNVGFKKVSEPGVLGIRQQHFPGA